MDMGDKITEITREIIAAGDSSECPRPVLSPMLWRDGSFPQKLRQTEQEMRGFFTNRSVIIEPFQDLGFDCLALFTQGNRALTTASKSLLYYLAWISGFSICFDVEHPMFFLSRYKKGSPLSHALDSKNPFIIAHILNMLKRFPPGYESMVQTQNLRQKLVSLLASVTLQYPLFGNYLFLQYEQLLCYYQPSRSPSKIQVYQTALAQEIPL